MQKSIYIILLSSFLTFARTAIRKMKLFYWFIATLIIAGCASTGQVNNWPTSIPDRKIFVESYQKQNARIPDSLQNTLKSHLNWVKRFYLGTAVYSNGWNKVTTALLEKTEDFTERKILTKKMHDLGIKICIEWVQDNSVRLIDSSAVAIWGNSLITAANLGEQLIFISKVENDVNDLIEGRLISAQITNERYYPSKDYDDF